MLVEIACAGTASGPTSIKSPAITPIHDRTAAKPRLAGAVREDRSPAKAADTVRRVLPAFRRFDSGFRWLNMTAPPRRLCWSLRRNRSGLKKFQVSLVESTRIETGSTSRRWVIRALGDERAARPTDGG